MHLFLLNLYRGTSLERKFPSLVHRLFFKRTLELLHNMHIFRVEKAVFIFACSVHFLILQSLLLVFIQIVVLSRTRLNRFAFFYRRWLLVHNTVLILCTQFMDQSLVKLFKCTIISLVGDPVRLVELNEDIINILFSVRCPKV